MDEEAAEEFDGRKAHRLAGIAVVVVAIPERDALPAEGDDALVRDRDSCACTRRDTPGPARLRRMNGEA
jgi:hypothetical protein